MKKYLAEIIAIIAVVAVIIGGVYSGMVYRERNVKPIAPGEPNPGSIAVQATKTYSNGVHQVRGIISLPTPCHTLEVASAVMESYPEQVRIDLNVKDSGNPCIQVIDERAWSVDVKASEQASFQVMINGEVANIVWLPV